MAGQTLDTLTYYTNNIEITHVYEKLWRTNVTHFLVGAAAAGFDTSAEPEK